MKLVDFRRGRLLLLLVIKLWGIGSITFLFAIFTILVLRFSAMAGLLTKCPNRLSIFDEVNFVRF